MNEKRNSWLLEMWKIKVNSWRGNLRLYIRWAVAVSQARLFPATEMRKLEKRLGRRRRFGEDTVLLLTGKWFALLEKARLRPSCLVRSLALARVLREEGHDAHLVFGVRSDNGEMEGHCWVAVGGRPVTKPSNI
jgi:Transglutaminase-like superfamily